MKLKSYSRNKVKKVEVLDGRNYYDTEYPHEFPIGNYYASKYKCFPSCCDNTKNKYKLTVNSFFVKKGFELIWVFRKANENNLQTVAEIYERDGMLVHIKYKGNPKPMRNDLPSFYDLDSESLEMSIDYAMITFYYNDDDVLYDIYKGIAKYIILSKTKSKISLVTSSRAGLSTIEQNIKPTKIDIPLHYGEGFLKVHNKIVEKLNEDKGKGLVLLHGIPGTGKTNYIRYLCGLLNKEVIFLPPFMAESISSPDFISFLLDHTNSILVIEDAEKIVLDREGDMSSRQSVANLLNMTDGLLSDCLSIQIIATFNTSRDRIDKALLRKGRLIAEWKFDALSVEASNKLLESIGREEKTNKPLTLTEIYNIEEELSVIQEERRQIGFR